MMKKFKLRRYHAIVLYLAILLTTISIIGSFAIAGMLPFSFAHASSMSDESVKASHEYDAIPDRGVQKANGFSSVVKPRLTDCFNCGVVVDTRVVDTAPENVISAIGSTHTEPNNLADQLVNRYLDAHQKNARLLTTNFDLSINDRNHDAMTSEQKAPIHIIDVRMRNGRHLEIKRIGSPQHRIGDKVRVINDSTITA
jgi:hypothetical protein